MRFRLRLLTCIAVLVLFAGVYAARVWVMPVTPSQIIEPSDPSAEITLKVLTENCGKCHLPGQPTTDPKALAVFDLAEKPWYGRVTDEHLARVVKRIRGSKEISEDDKATVEKFLQNVLPGK